MEANGDARYQPEFSLGERMASLESVFAARAAVDESASELFDEKLSGVRKELGAINAAQKEAVAKAESATDRRLELLNDQADKRAEITNQRLQALERGESIGQGLHQHQQQLSASFIAWAGVIVVFTSLVISVVFHFAS